MGYSFGSRTLKNIEGLHPDFRRVIDGAILTSQVDFGCTEKQVRTAAYQHSLWEQGRTKPGPIVTQKDGYKKKSDHQVHADGFGHAVDLTPYIAGRGYILTEDAWDHYPVIASAVSLSAKALGLASHVRWGCEWKRPMSAYGSSIDDMRAVLKTGRRRGGFIDGPHFQFD